MLYAQRVYTCMLTGAAIDKPNVKFVVLIALVVFAVVQTVCHQ